MLKRTLASQLWSIETHVDLSDVRMMPGKMSTLIIPDTI